MLQSTKHILQQICSKTGQIAILIDPEKSHKKEQLQPIVEKAEFAKVDYIFVGGSTVAQSEFETTVQLLKSLTNLPIIIFPGGAQQLSKSADGLLYLSLLSGRNPEYLIGQHVTSAKEVFDLNIEIIPTAYILVDGNRKSSVAYVSQTTPIPNNSPSIALRTALAGVMQGKQLVFFDAGSGANTVVPKEYIQEIKAYCPDIPVIVGGGIRSIEQLKQLSDSGANVTVVGNKIEEDLDFLLDISSFKKGES